MNKPEHVLENFIEWYTTNDEERDQLKATLNDPCLSFYHDEDVDEEERIAQNIENVLVWVNRNWSKTDINYLNLLSSIADYFREDHVDGWGSVEDEES